MELVLPSNGKTGKLRVAINPVRIGDLREIANYPEDSVFRKQALVKSHLVNSDDFAYLTSDDLNYLFIVLVGSLNLNKFGYKVNCQNCGTLLKDHISLESLPVKFLDSDLIATKNVFGENYTFHVLMASDDEIIEEYSLIDEDNKKSREEDAFVCRCLGLDITEESISYVRGLDISIYYLCYFFQMCSYHGTDLRGLTTCSCGKLIPVTIPCEGDLLSVDVGLVMERFASLCRTLDFQSFQSLSLPEYNSLIQALNKNRV